MTATTPADPTAGPRIGVRSGVVAVTGAAGKTGRAVLAALQGRGVRVRAIVRHPPAGNGINHAEVRHADLRDPDGMRRALAAARAVYLIAPNLADDEPGMMDTAFGACVDMGVTTVVYHSVMHPFAPAMPHHLDKARVESALHDSSFDWTILQPASYFENVAGVLHGILATGIWPVPYPTAATFTSVALSDVAEAAARVLTEDGHRWATYELAGPQQLSTDQMAGTASAILGRTVTAQYVPAPAGIPRRLRAMFDHYAVAGFRGNPGALAALLGREPTNWATWLRQTVGGGRRG